MTPSGIEVPQPTALPGAPYSFRKPMLCKGRIRSSKYMAGNYTDRRVSQAELMNILFYLHGVVYYIIYSQAVFYSLFYPHNCIQHNGDGLLNL